MTVNNYSTISPSFASVVNYFETLVKICIKYEGNSSKIISEYPCHSYLRR